jgi:uncharacterized protein YecE (DUF72 family)
MTRWYIGTMGFGYKPWQGAFYPEKLPKAQQLAYYVSQFNALEMDSTFYGTPRAESVVRWGAVAPEGFKFCPKAPREITHDLRLAPATAAFLDNFLDTMRLLGEHLGPVVFQFPPDFDAGERDNLDAFLARLPRDVRFAVEVRHRSWWSDDTAAMFQAHNVCWIAADYIYLPKEIRRTTDFLYIRFLGRHGQFATKTHELLDKTADLQNWQAQVAAQADAASEAYAFFNDDYAGHSPGTARRFMRLLGLDVEPGLPEQGRLF